jgi:ATP-dependent DNA helicase RecG
MCHLQQHWLLFQLGRLFQMLEAVGTRVEKEELLYKCKSHELNTVGVDDWSPLTKKLLRALPYWLTPSQLDAVQEIIWDLRRPVPMNRLLQVTIICTFLSLLTNQFSISFLFLYFVP